MDVLDGRFKNVSFLMSVILPFEISPSMTAYISLVVPQPKINLVYLYKALTDNEGKVTNFLKKLLM